MPYEYKGHTLPIHKDKNWHSYVDPFFRELIDKNENFSSQLSNIQVTTNNYIIEEYDELNDIIYTLRSNANNWIIYKVVNTNDVYTSYTFTSNTMDKTTAWNNRNILIYI